MAASMSQLTKEQHGKLSDRGQRTNRLPSTDRDNHLDGHEMTTKDEFEHFTRPRSFSDISISSGKYVLPGKSREMDRFGQKTSMKVFVRRKSEVIKGLNLAKLDSHSVDRHAGFGGSDVRTGIKETDLDEPPPKPSLPKSYAPKYFSQELEKQKKKDVIGIAKVTSERSVKVLDVSKHHKDGGGKTSRYYDITDKHNVSPTDAGKGDHKTDASHGHTRPRLRPQRSSEPNMRTRSVIYRHHDAKMQSDLLKKELTSLSKSEHVRRTSETMRQRLFSGERQGLGERLGVEKIDKEPHRQRHSLENANAGNATHIIGRGGSVTRPVLVRQSESLDHLVHKSEVIGRDGSVNRPVLVRQSESLDHLGHKSEGKLGTVITDSARNQVVAGTLSEESYINKMMADCSAKTETKSLLQGTNGSFREARRISNEKSQPQGRSKSASNISRILEKDKLENTLGSNRNGSQMSRSVSNLRRKKDTIRKFNSSAAEQKRDIVRQKFQLHGARGDSDEDDTYRDVSSDMNIAQDRQFLIDVKHDRTIGDNRSDEEKYAALSRNKILHSKSSSYDAQINKESRRNLPNHLSLDKMKELKFERQGARKDLGRTAGGRGRQRSSKGGKADDEVSVSDSECIVNKGSRFSKNLSEKNRLESAGTKMVLRQCRVGGAMAFGLVGVKEAQKKPNGNGFLDGQGLVTIRMIPDEQGRFGFNVKGGVDQGMPIIVSRVAPNTPAENAIPRLNEGDQVLFINGRDVSQHTHEQVVMFIRASRETHSGELVLKVRQNAYSGDDQSDEPDFVYDPETHQISSATTGANALEMSLKLLEESLESGAALAQFEQLYRKKPGMTMNTARLEINVNKNRYRDISPYDQTRVILKNSSGDYINANYVNMEIPVSGIVNRYIAAQGPLPTTCTDFWQMIWEQQSTLVIMLTTKVERGRVKCHQYWPDLYETSDYGHLQITCVKEEESPSFAFREFNLTHVESQEERHISHMQYIAWPDHGVPDDPADFLEFVIKVRQKRVGLVEPSVVHCSAGIGRTGVLITMETAMCLIEANQPVYPLSIVRQMRDQRAMLIQTPNQYKFVCEAIIRCFHEGIVKPLPEYQQR